MFKEDLMYHIHCKKGDVGEYVILPGDPGRTDLIASRLDNAVLVAHNREHKTWTGYLDDVKVSVTSTGMGGASASIALEELIRCGATTFVRVGTAGRVAFKAQDAQVEGVICTSAVRDEGLTKEYVDVEYPAAADRTLVNAFVEAKEELNYNFLEGITHCKDSFYAQVEPETIPRELALNQRWTMWEKSNVLCAEMESAALFVVASIREKRAASIMSFSNMEHALDIAINGLRKIIANDKQK